MGLILYVVYKIGAIFFRAGAASQQFRQQQQGYRTQEKVNNTANVKRDGKIKGGEYVDYEEVK